jgi:hypothetical protein
MKKTALFILVLLTFSISLFAQKLEKNASFIKDKFSSLYDSSIRKFAIEKWKDDSTMVYNEINKQSNALADLLVNFKPANANILYKSIIKCSINGKSISNEKKWSSIKTIGFGELLVLECEWAEVKKEYEKKSNEKFRKVKIGTFIAIPIVIALFILTIR